METNLAEERHALIQKLQLSMTAEFVPQSKSRNAEAKDFSLNWKITIKKGERDIIATDYMQRSGHIPLPKGVNPRCLLGEEMQKISAETGHIAMEMGTGCRSSSRPINPPSLEDVLYSLLIDADAIDYTSFEDWADNLGFDTDSRKAEQIYRACLEIGLKLRNGIGDANLSNLRDAFQDY